MTPTERAAVAAAIAALEPPTRADDDTYHEVWWNSEGFVAPKGRPQWQMHEIWMWTKDYPDAPDGGWFAHGPHRAEFMSPQQAYKEGWRYVRPIDTLASMRMDGTPTLVSLRSLAPAPADQSDAGRDGVIEEWNKLAHDLVVNSTAMLASLHAANRHDRPVAKTILQFETQAEALLDRWVELRQRGTPFDRALFIERLHVVDGSIVRESILVEDTWKERSAPAPADPSEIDGWRTSLNHAEDAGDAVVADKNELFGLLEGLYFRIMGRDGIFEPKKAIDEIIDRWDYVGHALKLADDNATRCAQADQSDAGRDGVPSSRQEIALHFCTHTWTASERSIDPTIACEPCCKKADTIIRALASAPSETVGSGELETEVEELRALVGKLNGGAEMQELMRLNNGLADKVRNLTTLLDQQLGTPCEQIRHAQEVEKLQALVLPTADRDAIREALKGEERYLIRQCGSEADIMPGDIEGAFHRIRTAALGLLGEG